jgi:hypothetical protein
MQNKHPRKVREHHRSRNLPPRNRLALNAHVGATRSFVGRRMV